jgi:glycosyltransferase involved in cell wall biosynthesis
MAARQRKKILLVIPHLGGGGAEQVVALLARNLSREKYEIHLCLVTQGDVGEAPIPPWVIVHAIGAPRVRNGFFALLRLVLRLKPAVVLSGMAHLNVLVLGIRRLFPRGTCVLVRQNSSISLEPIKGIMARFARMVFQMLYQHADSVVCQSCSMALAMREVIHVSPHRVAVLSNPVDLDGIRAGTASAVRHWAGPGPHLLAVGRLSDEKGFDLLLQAFAPLHLRFPTADLIIAGTGYRKAALMMQRDLLGLRNAVQFPGHVTHPADFFGGATLFVLSSRDDGMPNALLEAVAGGLPIVAMPASEGLVDLLRDKPGVWMAKGITTESLGDSLLEALLTLKPGQRFAHPWIDPFRLETSIAAYEDLIDRTMMEATQ